MTKKYKLYVCNISTEVLEFLNDRNNVFSLISLIKESVLVCEKTLSIWKISYGSKCIEKGLE